MRKVTAVFVNSQIDLVLVPAQQLRLVRLAVRCGLHRHSRILQVALNEIATCLNSGYQFIKGEKEWGGFYSWIAHEMPGVRVNDDEAKALADGFLCDLLWVFQKLERGEFSAAQFVLHSSLAETNFRLIRELRLRRGQPLPSFGLGRRVESLLTPSELEWVKVNARLNAEELRGAAGYSFAGLRALMMEIVPAWKPSKEMESLLVPYVSSR